MPTPRDFVKHDLTQCPHGQLARQCLLCEQAAEIERLRADTKALRNAVVSAAERAGITFVGCDTPEALADEVERLRQAISLTLEENGHLADGDVCTLIRLKVALQPNAEVTGLPREGD